MKTPHSLCYVLIMGLLVTSCGGGLGDYGTLTRRMTSTGSRSSGASAGASIDAKTQTSEKSRLMAEGKKTVEHLVKLKSQLEDLQQKIDQPDAALKKPQEVLQSVSMIVADFEKDAATLKDVAEGFKAVSEGKAPGPATGLGLTDAPATQGPEDAQTLLRRVSRLTTASDSYFLQGKEDCKNDKTPTINGFSAASFYKTEFEHCRGVNHTSEEQVADAANLSLRELGIFEIIGIIIRSLITLLMRITTAVVLGFLFGDEGSQLVLNPLLGHVMHHNKTKAIFWGTSWKNDDSDVIPGIDQFLGAWGGSRPASLANEYFDIHGPITSKSEYVGHIIDDTPAPNPDMVMILFKIMGEVCRLTENNPDNDTIYMVYTDSGLGDFAVPAIHYPGLCGRKPFQIAWMPKIEGYPAGYGFTKTDAAGHSPMLGYLAMVSAHEIWETMANPTGDGWYTLVNLGEIGDRCYTVFPNTPGQFSTLSDGSKWRLHTVWSNAAFKAKSGLGDKKACIH